MTRGTILQDRDKRRAALLSLVIHLAAMLLLALFIRIPEPQPEERFIVLDVGTPAFAEEVTNAPTVDDPAPQALEPQVADEETGEPQPQRVEAPEPTPTPQVVQQPAAPPAPPEVVEEPQPQPEVATQPVTPLPEVVEEPQPEPQPVQTAETPPPPPPPAPAARVPAAPAAAAPTTLPETEAATSTALPEIDEVVLVPRPLAQPIEIPRPSVAVVVPEARTITATPQVQVAEARTVPQPEVAADVPAERAVPRPDVQADVPDATPVPEPQVVAEVPAERPVPSPTVTATVPDARPVPSPDVSASVARNIPEPQVQTEVAAARPVPSPEVTAQVPTPRAVPTPDVQAAVPAARPVPTPTVEATVPEARPVPQPQAQATVPEERPVAVVPRVSVAPAAAVPQPSVAVSVVPTEAASSAREAAGAERTAQSAVAGTVETRAPAGGNADQSGQTTAQDDASLTGLGAAAGPDGSDTPTGAPAARTLEPYRDQRDRPLAVVIDNVRGYPQAGLGQASAIYEMPVEGGLTRLLTIFDRVDPTRVGPVRSSRDYMVEATNSLNGLLVHDGGAPSAMALIARKDVPTFNSFTSGDLFARDGARQAPYNLFSTGSALRSAVNRLNLNQRRTLNTNRYRPAEDATVANAVSAAFSASYSSGFRYVESLNLYRWVRSGMDAVDASGEAVHVDAVLRAVIDAQPIPGDSEGRLYIPMNRGGEATLFLRGTAIEGRWSLSDGNGVRFVDSGGEPIDLAPFKHWVMFTPRGAAFRVE